MTVQIGDYFVIGVLSTGPIFKVEQIASEGVAELGVARLSFFWTDLPRNKDSIIDVPVEVLLSSQSFWRKLTPLESLALAPIV